MVLEATMICIDNSEWMRNGDYAPTRFQAQADAVNLICGAKTQSNPENTVGVLAMAGKGVRVMVTPTSDLGKILTCMHGLDIGGKTNLASGIQIAQLALKHRQNKLQQQRIIVFAGSAVNHEKETLEMIGRKLKKNSVALDIIEFGEQDEEKSEKLEALHAAVNDGNSNHVKVKADQGALSDVLISSAIFTGAGEGGSGYAAAAAAATAVGGVSGFDFGVDPNLDPELGLALRVSMEEERARQEAAAKKAAEDSSKQEKGGEEPERASAVTSEAEYKSIDFMDDDNALLQQALAMSMDDPTSSHNLLDTDMSEAVPDDPDLALALQMSVQEGEKDSTSDKDMSKLLADQSFVSSIIASLPGVDPNDPSIRDLLASMQNQSEDKAPYVEKASKREAIGTVIELGDIKTVMESTPLPFLPDFIWLEIFIRSSLPMRTFAQLSCFNKTWHSAITSDAFRILHTTRDTGRTNFLLLQSSEDSFYKLCPATRVVVDLIQSPFPLNEVSVLGSCKGLLLVTNVLRYESSPPIHLWNPSLGVRRQLAAPPTPVITEAWGHIRSIAFGLGFNSKSGQFEVVRINATHGYDAIFEVEVYDIVADIWIRLGELNGFLGDVRIRFDDFDSAHGIYSTGCLYWLVNRYTETENSNLLLIYDLSMRRFRVEGGPEPFLPESNQRESHIGIHNDRLSCAYCVLLEGQFFWQVFTATPGVQGLEWNLQVNFNLQFAIMPQPLLYTNELGFLFAVRGGPADKRLMLVENNAQDFLPEMSLSDDDLFVDFFMESFQRL